MEAIDVIPYAELSVELDRPLNVADRRAALGPVKWKVVCRLLGSRASRTTSLLVTLIPAMRAGTKFDMAVAVVNFTTNCSTTDGGAVVTVVVITVVLKAVVVSVDVVEDEVGNDVVLDVSDVVVATVVVPEVVVEDVVVGVVVVAVEVVVVVPVDPVVVVPVIVVVESVVLAAVVDVSVVFAVVVGFVTVVDVSVLVVVADVVVVVVSVVVVAVVVVVGMGSNGMHIVARVLATSADGTLCVAFKMYHKEGAGSLWVALAQMPTNVDMPKSNDPE